MMLTRNKLPHRNSSENLTTHQKYSLDKCRVCLEDGEVPIFGVNDISEHVKEFGKIEVRADDNLPQYLCDHCKTLLEAAMLFRKTAKQVDKLLREPKSTSDSEESDYIPESEPSVKKEYLEFCYSSESELDTHGFDDKLEAKSNDENYHSLSEDMHAETNEDSNVSNIDENYQINMLNLKEDEDEVSHDADNEMMLIIVSDKDKQYVTKPWCEKCNITFETVDELKAHKKTSHFTAPSNQRECEICHNFVDLITYDAHLKEHRDKYKQNHEKKYGKVECKICGKQIGKGYYKYHIKMHGSAEQKAERQIECPFCKKNISAHYFPDHVRRMHDKKSKTIKPSIQSKNTELENLNAVESIKCPICDKNIKEHEYKLHLAKHGGPSKLYICDQCGKEFKHHSAFKTHCLTHGSELKYKCQFCPYRGLHQALLKIHVRTHTGDYNYKCTECPAKFITKSNLSKHLLRHKGVCNFICDICHKGFYTKRDLVKHATNKHKGVKDNVCDICGKGFGHRDNMMSHQLKVHKRDKIISRGRLPTYLKAEQTKKE